MFSFVFSAKFPVISTVINVQTKLLGSHTVNDIFITVLLVMINIHINIISDTSYPQ